MGSVADGVRKKNLKIIANWGLGCGQRGTAPSAAAHGARAPLGGAGRGTAAPRGPGGGAQGRGGDPTQSAEARRVTEW